MRGLLDSLARVATVIGMADDQTPPKRGAQPGNANAARDDGLDDQITIRIKRSERDSWMKAKGKDGKLALWVRQTLNEKSGHPPP